MLHLVFYILSYSTFEATIKYFPLPKQSITVVQESRRTAKLYLKGAVNMQDSVDFIEDIENVYTNKVSVRFGDDTKKVFNRYNCDITNIELFDDFIKLKLKLPIIGNINVVLKEAYRVLKPGGRFMCLEFSKIDNELLNYFYKQYSKTIPLIGKFIVGSDKPYKYLIESIEKFYNQEQLAKLILDNGFSNVEYRNVSNGISAIHSGWKI